MHIHETWIDIFSSSDGMNIFAGMVADEDECSRAAVYQLNVRRCFPAHLKHTHDTYLTL